LDEINDLLLKIYQTSQTTSHGEFTDKIFSLIKNQINFDSGGFCDFSNMGTSGIKLISAAAHNISPHDKLRARQEYIETETVEGLNTLASADPSFSLAFKHKGRSVSLSIKDKGLKSNIVAYGEKTGSSQTLVMVLDSPTAQRFQTLSLWRRKTDINYLQTDHTKANIILPHIFQAFAINRQLHKNSAIKDPAHGTAICSLSGTISFIDEVAINLLLKEFHEWNPPFLPAMIMEKLRSTSEKIYIGKQFTLNAKRQKDVLFLNFKKSIRFERLSPTELVIAEMLARNETYKAIAQKLGNQPATVRNQAHSIYMKLGISGKAELTQRMSQNK
jgi:DNA-binding CsgD family transcriptional regulator